MSPGTDLPIYHRPSADSVPPPEGLGSAQADNPEQDAAGWLGWFICEKWGYFVIRRGCWSDFGGWGGMGESCGIECGGGTFWGLVIVQRLVGPQSSIPWGGVTELWYPLPLPPPPLDCNVSQLSSSNF